MKKKRILTGLLSFCMMFSAVMPQTMVKAEEKAQADDAVIISADSYLDLVQEQYQASTPFLLRKAMSMAYRSARASSLL